MNMKELGALDSAVEKLKDCAKDDNCETAHIDADSILCDLLRHFGCGAAVDEWKKIYKWYA